MDSCQTVFNGLDLPNNEVKLLDYWEDPTDSDLIRVVVESGLCVLSKDMHTVLKLI